MDNEVKLEVTEARAAWEAPAVTEYDAKAEIQGTGIGPNEVGLFTS